MPSGSKNNTTLILSDAELEFCARRGGKSKTIHEALKRFMADTGVRDRTLDEMDAAIAFHAVRIADIYHLRSRYGAAQGQAAKRKLLTKWGVLRREVFSRGSRNPQHTPFGEDDKGEHA